ncbi:pyridoxamine 5'-phosphate oxidase family protein [Roseisolibacter sp. H3M3-2]|uniref:pyridoxamine 5'-phosphate oxidase family protein n=1 Tax=Roseisolibacter sp. H3M3-2 TaxID=3031323 RepID=UPI0023DC52EA|nr:pyridoxamine 5'-phosphate oxidase family protein [Roseisolibacter sp. H3M3-2]MDF1501384.1 pyridoxamine 5'-phosphate oxidase family protein [Roseisolibacter sp. H3M3-2]
MTATPTAPPTIVELSRADTEALLRAQHVGRIAYSGRDRVDVEPIHYVYDDGAIYARTSPGAKLLALRHHPWVAFEVDEVRGLYDWRSAVVHGTVYTLAADGPPRERDAYAHALALLRTLEPAALTARDPVPWRTTLFRISVGDMTGRAARTAGGAP